MILTIILLFHVRRAELFYPRVEVTKPRGGDQKKEVETKPRLFIGDIKEAIEKEQLTAAFQRFGTITDIWVAHNPPGEAPKGQF